MTAMPIRQKMPAFVLLAMLALIPPASAETASPYHLSKTISLPDAGGWDYVAVDDAARRVYVSHGTEVDILDADSYKIVGKIDGLQGVHGIALAPDLGRGFISDGKASHAVTFDLKTLKNLATTDTGENPDAIVYEPVTHKVFTFNGRANNATVIDPVGGGMITSISLGGRPEFAVADGAGNIYEDLEDKSELVKIDARQSKVIASWPLAPAEEPSSLAIDAKNHRLFAGCHNKLLDVVNADTGKVVATLPIGEGVDAAVFDPQTAFVITTNGEGTMTVIHEDTPDKYHVVATVETQKRSRTLGLDKKTHRLFVPAAKFGPAPQPTADKPHPRPVLIPGSFSILVFDEKH